MNVGFIGLGRMGSGMAGRILEGGHDLVVYDVVPQSTAKAAAAGARVASSLADLSAGRDVVITMLAEDAAVHDVAFGKGGLRDSLPPAPSTWRWGPTASGRSGRSPLRTPRPGRRWSPRPCSAGRTSPPRDSSASCPAGPDEAVRRCEPLFRIIGRLTFHAGTEPEAASAIKLANNLVLGCAIQAMGEAFSLVRKYDVQPQVLYDVMTEGLFSAPAYKVYGKIIVDESYDRAGSTIALNLKDANLIIAAGDIARVPLPSGNTFRDRLLSAIAHGDADKDVAALALEQARASGLAS